MGKVIINSTTLENIANAIRAKTNSNEKLLPSEMPSAISSIDGGTTTGDVYISSYQPLNYEIINPEPTQQFINIEPISVLNSSDQKIYLNLKYTLSGAAGYVVGSANKSYDIENNKVIFYISEPRLVADVNEDGYTILYYYYGSYYLDYNKTQETGDVLNGKVCILKAKNYTGGFEIYSSGSATEIYAPEITGDEDSSTSFGNSSTQFTINLPNIKHIGSHAFDSYTNLTSINIPMVTEIESNSFYNCTNLVSINAPQLTTMGGAAFENCSSLASIDFPLLTSVEIQAFKNCQNLTKVILQNVTNLDTNSFVGCSSLVTVDLHKAAYISNDSFRYCPLKALIIRTDNQICTLASTYVFYNYDQTFKIYVPDDLVSSYKSATNWTAYSSKITPLSEYVEE